MIFNHFFGRCALFWEEILSSVFFLIRCCLLLFVCSLLFGSEVITHLFIHRFSAISECDVCWTQDEARKVSAFLCGFFFPVFSSSSSHLLWLVQFRAFLNEIQNWRRQSINQTTKAFSPLVVEWGELKELLGWGMEKENCAWKISFLIFFTVLPQQKNVYVLGSLDIERPTSSPSSYCKKIDSLACSPLSHRHPLKQVHWNSWEKSSRSFGHGTFVVLSYTCEETWEELEHKQKEKASFKRPFFIERWNF